MDNTFLDLPLDKDLYKPKKFYKGEKEPLRVLLTEGGSRIARNLLYKICSGAVFGEDQPIILHLVNAKGSINHKATLLDLEECSFSVLEDTVVSSEPDRTYGNVDVVIMIALFEEISGHTNSEAFLLQINKCRTVAKNITQYAKQDAKLVVCGPSTKGTMILLTCVKLLEPSINPQHVTGVVVLDETIAKALISKQLKTTTNSIKNVIIWGATLPDLHNATVFTYHPEDMGRYEKVELPLMEALNDHNWISATLIPEIYGRVLGPALLSHGTAVASATAKHLKLLFQGAESEEDIVSMGVIVPPGAPYGLTVNTGFALPVVPKNGVITVRENVHTDINTKLATLKFLDLYQYDPAFKDMYEVIKYIREYELEWERDFVWNQHTFIAKRCNLMGPYLKYIISPFWNEEDSKIEVKDSVSKKSITWDEVQVLRKSTYKNVKSILRFNIHK